MIDGFLKLWERLQPSNERIAGDAVCVVDGQVAICSGPTYEKREEIIISSALVRPLLHMAQDSKTTFWAEQVDGTLSICCQKVYGGKENPAKVDVDALDADGERIEKAFGLVSGAADIKS